MTKKVKAGHLLAYMLIVLMVVLNMTTAIAFSAAGPAEFSAGPTGHDVVTGTGIHSGLGDPNSAEVVEEIYPTWDILLEYQFLREPYVAPAVTVCSDTDSPANSLFQFQDEIFLKLDPGIIAAFLQNKDGMK